MILVERHYTKVNSEITRFCSLSKDLYNRTNYLLRKAFFTKTKIPNISILVKETKNLDCFKQLHNTKTATQTIRKCLSDWSIYFKTLKAYKKDKSKFERCPKPPNYKQKLAQVIFFNETIKGGRSNKPLKTITTTNDLFSIKSNKKCKQVVITPKTFGFIIDIQYEKQKQENKLDNTKIMTIDIGLNNLCAITYDQQRPILVNGRILKSINQWYNKNQTKIKSRKRYFRIENYFHHVSKLIINLCLKHNIGRIIIGKNDRWKQNINLGKKTNQNFCMIPMFLLLQKISYKAELQGIEVIFTEESYTSKASFYDNDPLPKYGDKNIPVFSGCRKKRGLYITKDNFAFNADVNGSLNIGRKVIPEFTGIRDRSLVARPVVINPLKKMVGEGLID